ncbi:hypothetical protein ALT1644_550007 [Alteromonas macleodii]|jgi:hypothetical protein|nr:GIY-YIG nuclease family protein [Alteromonas sp. BZK5]
MSNASLDEALLKIGMTARDPKTFRAKELQTTGVPSDFVVEYMAFVNDYKEAEKAIHGKLSQFRYASNREFFKLPLMQAIAEIRLTLSEQIQFEELSTHAQAQFSGKQEVILETIDKSTKKVIRFKDGRLHGVYREFFQNGELKEKTMYFEGQKLGLSTKFKPDGSVKSKGYYYKDKRYGQWLVAFKGFIETRFYEGDTAVKTWSYTDKAGNQVSRDFQEPSEDYERMVDLAKGSSLRKR